MILFGSRRWRLRHPRARAWRLARPGRQKSYGPGVTDTEIKLGQTMPYSGPASSLGAQGLTDAAYFARLNEQGGINGRKVKLLSLDDGYSPPKTVEQTRKLIEQEQVLAIYHSLGTPTNSATYRYVNGQKVPQLFIVTGAEKFRDAVAGALDRAHRSRADERGQGAGAVHREQRSRKRESPFCIRTTTSGTTC